MSKRRVHHDGPYLCHFRCGAKLKTKFDAIEIGGWNWFTGNGRRTLHICPSCRFNRPTDVGLLMRARGITEGDDADLPQPYPTLIDQLPRLEVAP